MKRQEGNMSNYNKNQEDPAWQALKVVLPRGERVAQKQRKKLYGIMRRCLLREKQEELEAIQVFRLEDIQALRGLRDHLDIAGEQERRQAVGELQLSQEEKETEFVHWAFRRQSVNGDLLVSERLINFKMVRLDEYQYLLLCSEAGEEISRCFQNVFEKEPDLFSGNAITIESQSWATWIWIMHPNKEEAGRIREGIKFLRDSQET
jgi:hypothetical protein